MRPCPNRQTAPVPARASRRHRDGFGAAEVLIATAILGLSLLPVMSLFSGGSRQTKVSEAHVKALAIAEQALCNWEAKAIAEGFSEDVSVAEPAEEMDSAELDADTAALDVEVLLDAEELPGKPGLWSLTAYVTWQSLGGRDAPENSLVLRRLISRPALSFESDYTLTVEFGDMRRNPA